MSSTSHRNGPTSARAIPVRAILASAAFLFLGNGLTGTLIPLRARVEGFSGLELGILGSLYYAGFVLGSFHIPKILGDVGHIRILTVAASLMAACVMLQSIFVVPALWLLLRFCSAFSPRARLWPSKAGSTTSRQCAHVDGFSPAMLRSILAV